MNSLNRFRPAKQFRCLPLVGKSVPFGYVEIVPGKNGDNNYQPCAGMVAAFALMNEKGREEWLKLTAGSETSEVSRYGLSGGSQIPDALYTCATATTMNASALLSNSSANLQS